MSDCEEDIAIRAPLLWSGVLLGVVYRSTPALENLVKGNAMASDQDLAFMREVIKVMRDAGVVNKTGGPFGAVIVKDGQVIAAAGNSVIQDNDPRLILRSMPSARPVAPSLTGI